MENNEHIHAAMWAARRSGLYYTLVNTHLNAAEVAYIVRTVGRRPLFLSCATRALCELLSTENLAVAMLADDELDGWQRYPDCVAGEHATPIADESYGLLLQYSAGSTGRPKGIRRPLSFSESDTV